MLIESEAITRINKGSNKTETYKKAQVDMVDYNENNNKILEEFKAPNYEVIILKDNEFLNNELNKYSKPKHKLNKIEVINSEPMFNDEIVIATSGNDEETLKENKKIVSINRNEPNITYKANFILDQNKFNKDIEEYTYTNTQIDNNNFKKESNNMDTDFNKYKEKKNQKEIKNYRIKAKKSNKSKNRSKQDGKQFPQFISSN